jgi:P2 family phage contractile tail tube protein
MKGVRNNVIDHRLLDGGTVVEDVMSIDTPEPTYVSSEVNAAGMGGKVDMPDSMQLEPMTVTINHNNGRNCELLQRPGKHNIELRVARQDLNVAQGSLDMASDKVRIVGLLKSTKNGTYEKGNPLSGSVQYSVLRFERESGGKVITLIDVMANIHKINGVDYAASLRNMLD